jgi:hypothetical protein
MLVDGKKRVRLDDSGSYRADGCGNRANPWKEQSRGCGIRFGSCDSTHGREEEDGTVAEGPARQLHKGEGSACVRAA